MLILNESIYGIDKRVDSCFLDVQQTPTGRNVCGNQLGEPVSRSTCCCSMGKAWGRNCELCPAAESEEFKALCPAGSGFRPNMITVVLEDIDECSEMDNLCKDGRCSNTFGSFMCTCNDGYQIDDANAMCIGNILVLIENCSNFR